jgi:acetoin utilization protein AcuC
VDRITPRDCLGHGRVVLVSVEEAALNYDFGKDHPLRPERVLHTYDNIRQLGLTRRENVREVASRSARDTEIVAVHDPAFVQTVQAIDAGSLPVGRGLEFGLGTSDDPIFADMHAATAAVAGASLVAAEEVARGTAEHAFNPAGGLHHARKREASGFCVYNDPAIAIAKLLELRPDWRVMYIDVDVHHGDGVQWIFYDDPRVCTVSMHESGDYLYPGTGFEDEMGAGAGAGTAVNVPLMPYTGEDDYLWALAEVISGVATAFKPHALVTQLGGDTHFGDPLANLALTMPAYPKMARILHGAAHEYASGRWVATGGGGYQFDVIVPRIWTIHFAEMCGAADAIPEQWLQDPPSEAVSKSYRPQLERSVARVLEQSVPLLEALAN